LIRLAAYKRTRVREGKAMGEGRQWAPQYFWQVYAYGRGRTAQGDTIRRGDTKTPTRRNKNSFCGIRINSTILGR